MRKDSSPDPSGRNDTMGLRSDRRRCGTTRGESRVCHPDADLSGEGSV
jgi:hypothetical protein